MSFVFEKYYVSPLANVNQPKALTASKDYQNQHS
jgi:hypothetical protein